MRFKVLMGAAFLLICAGQNSFAGTIVDGRIVRLGLDNGAPDILFINIDKAKDSQPSCNSNGSWSYVLSLATTQGKNLYAMLLAAREAQSPLILVGAGACSVFGGIESLTAVYH